MAVPCIAMSPHATFAVEPCCGVDCNQVFADRVRTHLVRLPFDIPNPTASRGTKKQFSMHRMIKVSS
jgi:hypothetical protein